MGDAPQTEVFVGSGKPKDYSKKLISRRKALYTIATTLLASCIPSPTEAPQYILSSEDKDKADFHEIAAGDLMRFQFNGLSTDMEVKYSEGVEHLSTREINACSRLIPWNPDDPPKKRKGGELLSSDIYTLTIRDDNEAGINISEVFCVASPDEEYQFPVSNMPGHRIALSDTDIMINKAFALPVIVKSFDSIKGEYNPTVVETERAIDAENYGIIPSDEPFTIGWAVLMMNSNNTAFTVKGYIRDPRVVTAQKT